MAYNILIVDDSQTMRAVLTKTIDMAGIDRGRLYEAGNGKEALEVLESEWIDIVFADINMPVMNGIEMVEQMVERGYMANTPVIVISTEGSKTRLEGLKNMGVKGFLRKPISPELFQSVVEGVLAEKVGGGGGVSVQAPPKEEENTFSIDF
ncbi:MAG: response regulator [Chitinispirillales bacterium]|jgi:two-component system chemotaxis response regulator CheY|nr:response regulator [Chitinispirillales bacterium]